MLYEKTVPIDEKEAGNALCGKCDGDGNAYVFGKCGMHVGTGTAGNAGGSTQIQEILMLKKIAEQVVGWQVEKGYLPDGEREVYIYAYEVLLNQVINILLSVLIAIGMQDTMTVFVFLISYIPLRSYCGGYHAKTHLRCSVISAILLFVICVIMRTLNGSGDMLLIPMAGLLSGVLIFRYAPVESKNKPLDEAEQQCYRKRGRTIWLAEVVLAAIIWPLDGAIVRVIALSHITFSVMLCVEVLKTRMNVSKGAVAKVDE